MYKYIILIALLALLLASCNNQKTQTTHEEHEEEKIQFTAYSDDFEVFAEADPFVIGESSNVLSHFSNLPSFTALDKGAVTIRLIVNGKETTQTLKMPSRKGIYSFDIKPLIAGLGKIIFDIQNTKGNFQIVVPKVAVLKKDSHDNHDHAGHDHDEEGHSHDDESEAHEHQETPVSKVNTTFFTKEQSWKIEFATALPLVEPFGQVIKTVAQVQPVQGDEIIILAKTKGIVKYLKESILEGQSIVANKRLFVVSGGGMSVNNLSVQYLEAKNNYEKAKLDYKRAHELAKDKIVSAKELLIAKNQYDNAKATFNNLKKNFSPAGQSISSPMNGFVKQVFVQNGQYVEAGQPILSVSQNKSLLLRAEVQPRYASLLGTVYSANIRTLHNNQSYSFEQLNGKVLSFGQNTNRDNYLIPVNLQVDNISSFVPGTFVEIFLITRTNAQAITIPNTSLLEEQGNFFVYVQVNPELFEKREVKKGATDGFKTEILSGISTSERIVTKGAIFIKLAQATGTLDAHSGHVH